MAVKQLKKSSKNKRTYRKHKEHAEDMSYENELETFLKEISNNTPNEEQFKKKDLGKVKTNNRNRRKL